MAVFEPATVEWDGAEYTVPASRVLGLIAAVEDHVTLKELSDWSQSGNAKTARLAKAYAAALRYAGCDVPADEVYDAIFDGAAQASVLASIGALLVLMIPPKRLRGAKVDENPTSKAEAKS